VATAPTLQSKFSNLQKGMRKALIERNDEIDIFTLALLSRSHAFFLGSPGIAKSLLVESGMQLIDGLTDEDYFHILFMKSTTREDVFGPLSISAFKEDRYKFLSEGYLPAAKIVFGDEFWKANGAIQNALLWATNERQYRNDGKIVDIPLHSMFIASNELPDDEALLAIYDRFPLRKIVNPIIEPSAFIKMLKLSSAPLKPVISWDDVEKAAAEVKNVTIPDEVLEALVDVKAKLKEKEINPTDRRFKKALEIVRARAWLDGETEAEVEHLQPLRYVLWSDPNDFPEVEKLMLGLSNPIDLEIMKIQTDLAKLNRDLDKAIADPGDNEMRQRNGAAIYEKIKSAKEELVDISERLKGSKKRSAKLSEAADQVSNITKRMLSKIFDTSEEEIAEGLKDFVGDILPDDAEETADAE
jgi:MoxR-like ATPase